MVTEVLLQTEHLGWHTDDFLIVCEDSSGNPWKMAGQVKLSVRIGACDKEWRQVVGDFWKDFKNEEVFTPAADRLVLTTLRGTNALLNHFSALLECSRSARDAAEFEHRLSTSGMLNAKAVRHCDEIRTILSEVEGRAISAPEVWPFLRVLYVLSLDLTTATRQTEAMMKTILAYTAGGQEGAAAAEASWNALLREVSEGMPQARRYGRHDLPEEVRRRHSLFDGGEHSALRALADHSAIILQSIRSTFGRDHHLSRDSLVQRVIDQLRCGQVVLVSGPAGSGKSVVSKDALTVLDHDHFIIAFRAEEFARPHLDETLRGCGVPANARQLGAILASQDMKILLVESVERLLEHPIRDALTDLLGMVTADPSWRVILTCRDYSADLVGASLLEANQVTHSRVAIPPLSDEELEDVAQALPALARPLASNALRNLLRTPYVLDKASQMDWSLAQSLPETEREFRDLFWREIIRADHHVAHGMPRRREGAFAEIALRRARALDLYAACNDLDSEAVHVLTRDSVVVTHPDRPTLAAVAHDVLEDWAILRWIDEQASAHRGSLQDLCIAIGVHPAVRRTYRKWVSEVVESDFAAADSMFRDVIREATLPAHFRDDTLAALLRSPDSAQLLDRHGQELLANGHLLLRRVMHILRVACVTTPWWLGALGGNPSIMNVPDGAAWAAVLTIVLDNLDSFVDSDRPLLLGFIEDWAKGVSWKHPYPHGATAAAGIAYWLLPGYADYRSDDQRKRVLGVIAKLPKMNPEGIAALLRGGSDGGRDRSTEDLTEMVFAGLEGMPLARDLPCLAVEVAKDYLLCSEEDLRDEWAYGGLSELEVHFGIKADRSYGFFPASGYHGLFLPLLRAHATEGLGLVIDVANHSSEWYAHPRVSAEFIEPPFEITLTFADGTSSNQWCNSRLWNMYRGTSVGPNALQSILMALEKWLLEYAEEHPSELDAVLLDILKRSNSAAITAVVAGVATAHPQSAGESLLVLLRSPFCVLLDRMRLVHEGQAPSVLSTMIPSLVPAARAFEGERREEDSRPHRQMDLESAVVQLQLGSLASRVQEVLDECGAAASSAREQDEDDRVWRLALHRMDLRQYTPTIDSVTSSDEEERPEASEERVRVILNPAPPAPDLAEMVDETAERLEPMNNRLGLAMWGRKVFAREQEGAHDPAEWRERLQNARSLPKLDDDDHEWDLGRDAPGLVAAACVRDFWDEMTDGERDWCTRVVCSEVVRQGDLWDRYARVQRGSMSADRPCAWVIPALLGKRLVGTQKALVRDSFVVALTHAIKEVRSYAAWGIGDGLWAVDRGLALRCVDALAFEATLVQQAWDAERLRPHAERRSLDACEAEAARRVRGVFNLPEGIPGDSYDTLDESTWIGAEAHLRILSMLSGSPNEPEAIRGFERLARALVAWWGADDDHRRNRQLPSSERSSDTESALTQLLEQFLLRTTSEGAATIAAPVLRAVDDHPDKVHWLLRGIIAVEDARPNTAQFWSVWRMFADKVRVATWLEGIDREYAFGREMVWAVFLGSSWKEGVRHWRSLEGHVENVDSLFEDLPPSSTAMYSYVSFLYQIGDASLPEAFVRVATRLREADPALLLSDGNTVFMLEVILQRYVYGRPWDLKRHAHLRDAILNLLDALVETGSSAAFRMRDDFVTPALNASSPTAAQASGRQSR